jgi:hypothetical protein
MLEYLAAGRMLRITEIEASDLERQETAAMGEADLEARIFIEDAAEYQPRSSDCGVGGVGDQIVEKVVAGPIETDRTKWRMQKNEDVTFVQPLPQRPKVRMIEVAAAQFSSSVGWDLLTHQPLNRQQPIRRQCGLVSVAAARRRSTLR